jgi:two-component system sensor histidine kinase EvgS
MKSVAAIYEPAARGKGIALAVRAGGGREHERVWVMADALRLRQCFTRPTMSVVVHF